MIATGISGRIRSALMTAGGPHAASASLIVPTARTRAMSGMKTWISLTLAQSVYAASRNARKSVGIGNSGPRRVRAPDARFPDPLMPVPPATLRCNKRNQSAREATGPAIARSCTSGWSLNPEQCPTQVGPPGPSATAVSSSSSTGSSISSPQMYLPNHCQLCHVAASRSFGLVIP